MTAVTPQEISDFWKILTQPDTGLMGNIESLTRVYNSQELRSKMCKVRDRGWFFTWNNYDDTFDTRLLTLFLGAKEYQYQEEIGGKHGVPHIQGYVIFKNARYWTALYKELPGCWFAPLKSRSGAITYTSKENTRKPGGIRRTYPQPVRDRLRELEAYPWQTKILEELKNDPDDRKITWVYESEGDAGKTTLCKHIRLNNDKAVLVNGKTIDVYCRIADYKDETGNYPEIVLYNCPKSGTFNREFYEGIECIKDGFFFSPKYKPREMIMNEPHVIVFANFSPNRRMLGKRRFIVYKLIDKDLELQEEDERPERDRPAAHPGMNVVERYTYPEN